MAYPVRVHHIPTHLATMKIDPYNYPIIIIVAFVIGFVLAMALGFRPEHSSTESGLIYAAPAIVQLVETCKV
jgi:hypothetical protein